MSSTLFFAMAFDSINHRFLLAKIKSFGLGDVVIRWIEAYLSGWMLTVHVEALTRKMSRKMVTRRTQSMNLHSSLTAALDWSKKWHLSINPTKYNHLTIGRAAPLRLSFFPRWVWHPHHSIQMSQGPRGSGG